MPERWPHQLSGVSEALAGIRSGQRRLLVTTPTGGGKTRMMLDLAEVMLQEGQKVSLYTNRRLLIEQTSRVLAEAGYSHGIRAAGHKSDLGELLQVSSIQTEHSRSIKRKTWSLHHAALVLVDECFTAGTLVSTPRGEYPIENVRAGDLVYCATGLGFVEEVSTRPAKDLLRLEFDNGISIFCTPTHPFFTDSGWREAGTLANGTVTFSREGLCRLWQAVPTTPLATQRGMPRNRRKPLARADLLLSLLLEESQESNVRGGERSEDEAEAARDSTPPFETRRQWAINALGAAGTPPCARGGLGARVLASDPAAARKRLSHRLQDRHSEPNNDDRLRDRRALSPKQGQAGERREEDRFPYGPRLVRVSRFKRARFEPVFNLRIHGHPSYFANGILVHNCHLQTDARTRQILASHLADGAAVVGFTATPLGLREMYDRLIIAGTTSELRACGALVMARHYGPDEPDPREVKTNGEDLSERENVSAIMREGIFGRVLDWYRRLNPGQKPTILFAPGVRESLWFAEQFQGAGIAAAHVDGEDVWIAGQLYRTSRERRQEVLHGSKDGSIRVVCNRFVLREGVDAPWLAHGIFATVIGSLQSYLQAGGRLLRAHPGLEAVTIQDHGGNWHRHGSLNADRLWSLDDNASNVAGRREDRLRARLEREPYRCPECGLVTIAGRCFGCGWEPQGKKRSRPVVQSDGTLREMIGDIYRPRRICRKPNGAAIWERMYWRSRNGTGRRTFRQAFALFARENHWGWPDPSWPFMPRDMNGLDKFYLVEQVPMERLVPKPESNHH